VSAGLAKLNALSAEQATTEFLKACGSKRWVAAMVAQRPFSSNEVLLAAANREWNQLGTEDFLEAFAAHPRIGEKKAPPKNDVVGEHFSKWSSQEQAGAAAAAQTTLEKLKAQNDAYFEKHGFIFIVCATGKSADEMLGLLEARLPNARAMEIQNAAAEQAKITVIRLNKWLAENS
jgi:OHCU decarboxylase